MAGRRPESPVTPSREKEATVTSRMLVFWTFMLALGLVAGDEQAKGCTQKYGGPNLARGRPTSESSTHPESASASSAVDGNCNGLEPAVTCSHTNEESNPWWSVDLGREYAISLVVVKNREDGFGERIQGATIHVGDRNGDSSKASFTCGTVTDIRDGSLSTIFCNGAVGRYITIVIPGEAKILTLCEVEVYGTNAPFAIKRAQDCH